MNFLKRLFSSNIDNFFDNHPVKASDIIWSILVMATGTATFMRDGWTVFGTCAFILGFFLGVFIIFGIGWSSAARYWETMDNLVNDMRKTNNPELWAAFWKYVGLNPPAQEIRIEERKTDEKGNFTGFSYKNVPASPAVMQQIANAVLSGTPFSETEIAVNRKIVSPTKFREIQRSFRKNGWLRANVVKNGREVPNQGYSRTKLGTLVLLEYASAGVKMQLNEKKEDENANEE